MTLLAITGLALLALGILWHRLAGVSAERPAGLLTMFGAGMLIIAAAMFTAIPDTRGCPDGTPAWEASQGIVKCPQPNTTTYGFNREVKP